MSEIKINPPQEAESRDRVIIRTSWLGIIANIFLALFKAILGLTTKAFSIVLDAVNNLSDALSSVVTIIGTRIAGKRPDRYHPLGHGRAEYLSALIVAAIVLYAGISALIESVKKIITPETPEHTWVSIVIIVAAIAAKVLLGTVFKKRGKAVNSTALEASGTDALFDALLSSSVLLSTIIFLAFGVNLEAYVGVLISAFIIKAGIGMMKETLDDILGHRADEELTTEIKKLLIEEPEVLGAFDLFINNYGPDRNYASVHLELPDKMTVDEVDVLTRHVQEKVYRETGVILTGVGVYSRNTSDPEIMAMHDTIYELVMANDWALQLHGFHVDKVERIIRFDVVLSFDIDAKQAVAKLTEEVSKLYPGYELHIVPDLDISD